MAVPQQPIPASRAASLLLTVGALKTVVELPVYVKPRVFGGDGTTNLKVVLAGRRSI